MIEIGSAGEQMHERYLDAPGGFAWWYADLVTPQGDGVVLIWAYGLPFLPGYASASRRGAAERPSARPSINVVVYRGGREHFYLLQEHPSATQETDPLARSRESDGSSGPPRYATSLDTVASAPAVAATRLLMGRSTLDIREEGGRVRFEAALDCAVPGTSDRLTGRFAVVGPPALGLGGPDEGQAAHLWTPSTGPSEAIADLDLGGRPIARLRGRGYHDRNGGDRPLHDLGILRWSWGRVPFEGGERVFYLLWPEGGGPPTCIGLEIDADGGMVERSLSIHASWSRHLGGVRWPRIVELRSGGEPWLMLTQKRMVDIGPFYLRYLVEAEDGLGRRALGMGESCEPDRVDLTRHRMLVRMRVHRASGPNSVWLPLFSGPRAGRIRRLLGQLRRRSTA
jgi:carotenoid 1,2-hydratase